MSKKERVTETPVQEDKIVTRYDRRVQKRKEQEAKEQKEKKVIAIGVLVVAVAILALLISFPVRNYIAVNQMYVEVGGEEINKVEYDYHYHSSFNNYYNSYGMYLSYMGVDLSGDLSSIMYDDTLNYAQFFEQAAVESIKKGQALLAEAESAQFEFDEESAWEEFKASVKQEAATQGMSANRFLQMAYGSYATFDRLKDIVGDTLKANAYSSQIAEEMMPSEEDVMAYYEENKDDYDAVDYRVIQVDANLPTEPTELADPVEDTETESSDESTGEEEYQPSQAEIDAAMAVAKEEAEKAEATVAKEGELKENYTKSILNSFYKDWLFDASRETGDTTVVEDTTNHRYYVLAFEKRYLPENPTVNARVLTTSEDPQKILDKWTAGAADEDSFIELCDKYNENGMEGGLYEGITSYAMPADVSDWLFAEERVAGETTAITQESGTNYVLYYKEAGEDSWKLEVQYMLQSEKMSEYISGLVTDIEVNDPKENLEYIGVLEAKKLLEEKNAAQ